MRNKSGEKNSFIVPRSNDNQGRKKKKNPYSEDLNIKEIKNTRTWKDLCSMIDRVNTGKKTLLLKMTCRFNENSSKIQ